MAYWLVKTEPTDGGLLAFQAAAPARLVWDGVRNYQARNFLRAMDLRDEVLLYHASCAEIGPIYIYIYIYGGKKNRPDRKVA